MTPDALPWPETIRVLSTGELQLATAGEPGRPVVILLHGFPDVWQGWHEQIGPLAAAGYRVLAPNQRGYGRSHKPAGVAAYDLDRLAEDVVALADSEGAATFHLVGHDWGGIVAWWVAARYPERVARLVILNAPHPGAFSGYAWRHPGQLARSWYIGFFQWPWIPERMLAARNYALLFRAVKRTSQLGVFDESDRKLLVESWSQPGALTGMLNYYRAIARRSARSMQLRITTRTLILFSTCDPALGAGLADASLPWCDEAQLIRFEGARHWIQREEAPRVTAQILGFLAR